MTTDSLQVQKMRHPLKVRRLEVKRITELSPAMRRITLAGDDLRGFFSASFDDHVKLIVPEAPGEEPNLPLLSENGLLFKEGSRKPAMRDYTPRRYDEAANELDIDFVLHHDGPATKWAEQAETGHPIGIAGPRGSFVIPVGFDWHLLIGDETAIPAIGRRLEELPQACKAIVLIKITRADARIEFKAQCSLDVHWVVADSAGQAGSALLANALSEISPPSGEGYAWAGGEYHEIHAVRQHLLDEWNLDKGRIRASSYWREAVANTHEQFD